MKTLDKLRGNFFNKKSFNVGFNNRSPLSYISSTGPNVPAFADPGVKSFEPSGHICKVIYKYISF